MTESESPTNVSWESKDSLLLRSLGEDLRLERGTGWRVIEEEIEGVLQLEIETIRKVGAVILLDLKLELLIEFCLLLLQKVEESWDWESLWCHCFIHFFTTELCLFDAKVPLFRRHPWSRSRSLLSDKGVEMAVLWHQSKFTELPPFDGRTPSTTPSIFEAQFTSSSNREKKTTVWKQRQHLQNSEKAITSWSKMRNQNLLISYKYFNWFQYNLILSFISSI